MALASAPILAKALALLVLIGTWETCAPAPLLAPSDLDEGTHPAAQAGRPLISRVYANAVRDNEFIEIVNAGETAVALAGWSLTDGEAAARFPDDVVLSPGGAIVVTQNATSYEEDTLRTADFSYGGEMPALEGRALQLANTGDEVLLRDAGGRLADAYVYGEARYAGPGWTGPPARALGRGEVAVRTREDGILMDRDSALDWDGLRDHRLGQSSFAPPGIVSAGPALAIVSPDDGREPLLSFFGSAERSLELAAYTLTSEAIATALAGAARRGVRTRILLEGAPAGGLDAESVQVAADLARSGAEVRWLLGGSGIVKRYRYLHAKYAIVDASRILVGSENFGDAGFPASRDSGGNRGWSLILEEPRVALQLREVFEEDFDPSRRDTRPMDGSEGVDLPLAPRAPRWTSPTAVRPRRMQLVVGPEGSLAPEGLLGMLGSAQKSLWIEAFYLEDTWHGRTNPLLEAAFDAARRGVRVRIVLDGSAWSTDESSEGNDDAARRIKTRAAQEGLDLHVKLAGPSGRVERIHNKGVLVDGRVLYVGSMNWGLVSATANREVGIILDDPGIAARFEAALHEDWEGNADGEDAFRIDDPAALYTIYGIVTAAALLSLRNLRGSRKALRPRARMGRRGGNRSRHPGFRFRRGP